MKKSYIVAILCASAAGAIAQDTTPIQLSLVPDVSLYPRSTMVRGLALNFWGENPQLGLNFGIINGSTGDSGGFTWAFLANYSDSYKGVAWSLVNISREQFTGWQDGIVNISMGTYVGLQSGWVNYAEDFRGVQLGGLNYAEHLNGVQIGFINIAPNNPWFTELPDKFATGFPIVNWSF